MDPNLAVIVLAPLAVVVAILFLFTRRRRKRKKVAPPVRPSAPLQQSAANPSRPPAGIATTWAPPAGAHAPSPVAPTVVAPPGASPSWDQAASAPAKGGSATWGSPSAPGAVPGPPSAVPPPAWGAAVAAANPPP